MSFFDDLCYRCREERIANGYRTLVGDHCHHEPREKPVSKCIVCGDGPFSATVNTPRKCLPILIKFCPECGRSLI